MKWFSFEYIRLYQPKTESHDVLLLQFRLGKAHEKYKQTHTGRKESERKTQKKNEKLRAINKEANE